MKRNKHTKIKFLGTGANGGVPQVDCRCVNCRGNLIARRRSCILIEAEKTKLIIDCGPDFKTQLVENNIRLQDLSGIVISHLHWDHCAGLFELSSGKTLCIPIAIAPKLRKELESNSTFKFIFVNKWAKFTRIRVLKIKLIEINHDPKFPTFAIKISTGSKSILVATDIFKINRYFIKEAKTSDLIIFDGTFLNENKHWHLSIKDSVPILTKLNKKVIFTHVNHSESTKDITDFLKKFKFKLAFDGMAVKL